MIFFPHYAFLARPIKTNNQVKFNICEQALRRIVQYWKGVEFDHLMI